MKNSTIIEINIRDTSNTNSLLPNSIKINLKEDIIITRNKLIKLFKNTGTKLLDERESYRLSINLREYYNTFIMINYTTLINNILLEVPKHISDSQIYIINKVGNNVTGKLSINELYYLVKLNGNKNILGHYYIDLLDKTRVLLNDESEYATVFQFNMIGETE